MDLALNTLLTLNTGDAVTRFTGLYAWLAQTQNEVLRDFIKGVFLTDPVYQASKWETVKADNAHCTGKWPLRLHKAWKANGGAPLTKEYLATLGEKVRAENPPGQAFIEISDKIEWQAGDFGDTTSCWFQPNHDSYKFRQRFISCGYGYALKTYATAEAYAKNRNKGSGRAWVAEYDGIFYVWNGRGYQTETHAKNLASLLGPDWKSGPFRFIPAGSYVDGTTYIVYRGDPPKQGDKASFTLPIPKAETPKV